ncbi:MAG: 30S ribosomal protein S6 [Lentisphaerae bacterium]|nr:30S ribosomal protein S6 [Lentisphaerota bacterium]
MGRMYDATLIVPNNLKEEDANKVIEDVGDEVVRHGGRVESVKPIGLHSFVRRMNKQDSGYYARMLFEMDPDKVSKFLARLKLKGEVFRIQVTVYEPPAPEDESAAAEEVSTDA